MIEIACPACGAGGRVPNNKKDQRLNCKKCLAVFHLSPSGRPLLGEPPVQKENKDGKDQPRSIRDAPVSHGSSESFSAIGSALSQIKLPSPRTLGILLVVGLVSGLVYWITSRQSLESRTRAVAEAISNCDIKAINEMSVPDPEMNAMVWTNDVYKSYCEVQQALGGMKPGMRVQVTASNSGGDATALVSYSRVGARGSMPGVEAPPPPADKSAGAPKDSLELLLYWNRDSLGNWLFDAKRTREAANPPK
jgi:hypothetical protein